MKQIRSWRKRKSLLFSTDEKFTFVTFCRWWCKSTMAPLYCLYSHLNVEWDKELQTQFMPMHPYLLVTPLRGTNESPAKLVLKCLTCTQSDTFLQGLVPMTIWGQRQFQRGPFASLSSLLPVTFLVSLFLVGLSSRRQWFAEVGVICISWGDVAATCTSNLYWFLHDTSYAIEVWNLDVRLGRGIACNAGLYRLRLLILCLFVWDSARPCVSWSATKSAFNTRVKVVWDFDNFAKMVIPRF